MNVTLLSASKPTDTTAYFLVNKIVYKYTSRGVLYRVMSRGTKEEQAVEVDFDSFTSNTQIKIWECIEEHRRRVQEVNDLLETVRSQGPYGLGFDLVQVTENYGSRSNGAILLSHPLLDGWNLLNNFNHNFVLCQCKKLD